jgi:hypothetical protein
VTVLVGQGLEHFSGLWPFQVTPDLLEMAGCYYAPEQIALYEGTHGNEYGWLASPFALAVSYADDPRVQYGRSHALMQLDENHFASPVLLPEVVALDWDHWVFLDRLDPTWRRFPTLPARTMFLDDGEPVLGGVDGYRLWNLWPLDDNAQAQRVLDATSLFYSEHLTPLKAYLQSEEDPSGICEQVGTPPATHRHSYDEHGELVYCYDGEAWKQSYAYHHLDLDDHGQVHPVSLPPVRGLRDLEPVWQNLLTTSRICTQAGLTCFPAHERDRIRLSERYYSPWSWLS